uniref:Magnetosome protein MamS/MamX domain-containing protein n=1 Tax=Desulfobacca acetoxidans TaxID=60893 RepID=A0A7C3ZCE1_9BACT
MNQSGYRALAGIVLLSLTCTMSSAWAQGSRRLHYSTMFNPRTVTTVSGEVVRVAQAYSGSGADYCIQAVLRTPQGDLTVILAPKGYMAKQGLSLAPKDRVTVTGSLISIINKPFLLVMEMTGDRTMKLRDANGRPAWAVGDDWHAH